MSIPISYFSTFRISVDQCPQKLLIRKIKICEYLRFHPASNFPRDLKLKMLRYFKIMNVRGVKIKDEVTKPLLIYRQIFQRFTMMYHCRVDLLPSTQIVMNNLFLNNKLLNYHFLTARNFKIPKYTRKTTNLLIHPTLNLEEYLQFLKLQRHSRDKLTNIYIRTNDVIALNDTLKLGSIVERFPSTRRWTLFLNFPADNLQNFEMISYPAWKNLLWAYISIDRACNFALFLKNVDQMKDLYSLELAYYGINPLKSFDFTLFQKFKLLEKVKVFCLQFNLTQLKDINKFWLNMTFPPNVKDLGFHITNSKFLSCPTYEPKILNSIRKIFSELTQVEYFDAKFEFNEKMNRTHSYLLALIISCFINAKQIFLILAHFNRNAPKEYQACYLSLIYPVLSTLKELQFFHFQGRLLDRIYEKGTLTTESNPKFESLSIIGGEVKDQEILPFFEDTNYKKVSKLRFSIDDKIVMSPQDFTILVSKISEMKYLDQLSLSIRGKILEEDVLRFFLSIKELRLLYTLKFDALDAELQLESLGLIKNILTYHRNLLNVSVKLPGLTHNGNTFSYRLTL